MRFNQRSSARHPQGGRLQIGIDGRIAPERVAGFASESVADFKSESGGFCEVAVTEVDEALGRDLIEAGLNEPAGWRRSYGDCVCSSRSESRSRVSEAAIWPG